MPKQRRSHVSNETPNEISVKRFQDASVVRLHDVIKRRHDSVSRVRMMMIIWEEREIPSESGRRICLKTINDWIKSKNKQYLSKITSKSPKPGGEKLIFSPQGPEAYVIPMSNVFV